MQNGKPGFEATITGCTSYNNCRWHTQGLKIPRSTRGGLVQRRWQYCRCSFWSTLNTGQNHAGKPSSTWSEIGGKRGERKEGKRKGRRRMSGSWGGDKEGLIIKGGQGGDAEAWEDKLESGHMLWRFYSLQIVQVWLGEFLLHQPHSLKSVIVVTQTACGAMMHISLTPWSLAVWCL